MKIRKLTPELYPKAASLLDHAYSPSKSEVQLFDKLHEKERIMHEWVCIHRHSVIAYIGFTQAYDGTMVVGLYLALLAVKPQMQSQGIGSELLRFTLRQEVIKKSMLFVLGNLEFYKEFGFERDSLQICPLNTNHAKFLSMRNDHSRQYTVGFDPEFKAKKK